MKSSVNAGFILSGAMLINLPVFSQNTTNQSLNESKTTLKMETNQTPSVNKETVRSLYEDILSTGKFELLKQIVSEEYEGPRGIKGPAGFAAAISPLRTAFPDIKWTVEDLIAEGDKVVVKWSWKGTNTSSFDGFPASSKTVMHHAINIFQFEDHKIIKSWMQADRLGFYQQIGVIAPDVTTAPVK